MLEEDPASDGAEWPGLISANDLANIAIDVATAIIKVLDGHPVHEIEELPSDDLKAVLKDLQKLFDRLIYSHRETACKFYDFWRAFSLRLISIESEEMKLLGWTQIGDMINASSRDRPPIKEFEVSGAGSTFVNGTYRFSGAITPAGYAEHGVGCIGAGISYQREVPASEGGKKLTLFLCTMRSQQKWWFISEADDEQPGTDRDIDFYQYKSRENKQARPPSRGWITCRAHGLDPPPQITAGGSLVPPGEEFNTLEHQLASWAIENGLFELALRDNAQEVFKPCARALVEFLVLMREQCIGADANLCCIEKADVLRAWEHAKTTDQAASARACRSLVSILPLLPGSLVSPLLTAVSDSLGANIDGCVRAADAFAMALRDPGVGDGTTATALKLSDDMKEGILELLWSLLTQAPSSCLEDREKLEHLWSLLLTNMPWGSDSKASHCSGDNPAKESGRENDAAAKASDAVRNPSRAEILPDDLLLLVFDYLGPNHYGFVAPTSRRFRRLYRQATSKSGGSGGVVSTSTTMASVAESVSRAQSYIFQETVWMDLKPDKNIDALTRRMRRHVGKRAASVARAAASSGNQSVAQYALKQPEGLSITSQDLSICNNAAKNGHTLVLEHAISVGCACDVKTCELAAEHGQIDALEILRLGGCPWKESVCSAAASNGDLAMLKYAREYGCRWDRWTFVNAQRNGHLEVAEWARENGCGVDDDSEDEEEESDSDGDY